MARASFRFSRWLVLPCLDQGCGGAVARLIVPAAQAFGACPRCGRRCEVPRRAEPERNRRDYFGGRWSAGRGVNP